MMADEFEGRAVVQQGEIFAVFSDSGCRQSKWDEMGTVT